MTTDKNDHAGNGNRRPPGIDPDTPGGNERHEPDLGSFDEDDFEEYEEPDRDTGFTSSFGADDVAEEEEFDDLFGSSDSGEPLVSSAGETTVTLSEATAGPDEYPDEVPVEEPEEWLEDEEYYDADDESDSGWPLRLVAVATVAVVLVAAGVYGVLQERAATQEELRELRATLATSANQTELRSTRDSLRELQQSYDALAVEAEALALENGELRETIVGLEAQPESAGEREEPATPPPEVASTATAGNKPDATPAPDAPAATNKQASTEPAAPPPGRWFVNFGSYSSRTLAESWASRLRPVRGEVIVAPATKDGKTYYRVRVVGLSGKSAADLVARQLEAELQVSRLWVGQE